MNRKLKAFTLFELIIALTLSAIVSGLVYSSIHLIQGYFFQTSKEKGLMSEIELFKMTFQENIGKCEEWFMISEGEIQMVFPDKNIINFQFASDYVLLNKKSPLVPDTFHIPIRVDHVYHLMNSNNTLVPVVGIEFSSSVNESEFKFVFEKTYGANIHLKYDKNL